MVGVDQAGMEFMRSVFTLQAGQVGLAMDQPGKIVYVVRLINFTPGEETLWRQFAVEAAGTERDDAIAGSTAVRPERPVENLVRRSGKGCRPSLGTGTGRNARRRGLGIRD